MLPLERVAHWDLQVCLRFNRICRRVTWRLLFRGVSVLGLLGVDADPLRSREHVLMASILEAAWREGRSLDMAGLVREIQTPPFQRVGVVDLDSFFPAKDRFALAMQVNALLASPSFAAWLEGEPLVGPAIP